MIAIDYKLAHAAAWDAGDKSMRANGRDRWNEDDYLAAAREFNRIMDLMEVAA